MGRRESPVDPAEGPVQRFADELRKLRQEAGGPTYRRLAAHCDYSVTTLSQAAAGERLPSLPVALAYATACGGDREEWERRWHEAAGDEAARATAPEDETEEPPYRGLARFEPGDEAAFHGRTALTAELLELVRKKRFAAVFGPSGSGKSSLLRAGLIPRLRAEDEGCATRPAAVRILTPGEHPARTHGHALVAAEGEGETWVLVDQFEEIFTLCRDPAERGRFLEQLLASRESEHRLRVVIAVRADFYGRCAEHRALTEVLRDANLLVGPMSPAELREAVVRPAGAQGLIVERSLTARLVEETEAEPGGLPLMSHVLLETWRRRKGRTLTLEAYEAAGGVHGAVAQTAERVHSQLSPHQATVARRILLRLIAPGEGSEDTRRPAARDELAFTGGAGEEDPDTALVLERLVRARLLTLDEDTVDLAHEALITSWPRLRAWIEEDRDRLRAHRRLTEAARTWEELSRDPGALYRGSRLSAAEEHFAGPPAQDGELTRLERAFLTASQEARLRERRRLRGGAAALCTLLVLALLAGVVAWQQTRTNDRQHTEAEARRIAAVADSMRVSEPRRAMRLSVAAWRLADTPETRSALLGALSQPESDALTLPGGGPGPGSSGETERFLSADGRTAVTAGRDRVERWDVPRHRRLSAHPGTGADPVSPDGFRLSGDGRTLITDDEELRINARDLTRRTPARRVPGARGIPFAFSHDGRVLGLIDGMTAHGGVLKFWDVRRGRKLFERRSDRSEGPTTALTRDGGLAAVCREATSLELWRLGHGDRPAEAERADSRWSPKARGAACGGSALEFTRDGRDLLVMDGDGIHTRDVRTGREGRTYKLRGLSSMAVSSDGKLIVAAGAEELVVWRREGPRRSILRYPLAGESVGDIGIDTRRGAIRYLAGNGQLVRSLSLAGVHEDRRRREGAPHAVFSPDSRRLATARFTEDDLVFEMRDGHTGEVTDRLPRAGCHIEGGRRHDGDSDADTTDCTPLLAFTGGSRTLAYGTSEPVSDLDHRERVNLWDGQRQRRIRRLDLTPRGKETHPLNDVAGITFARDGRTLLVSRIPENEAVEAWDVRTGKRLRTMRHVGGSVLAPHPLRNEVVTGEGHFLHPGSGRTFRRTLTQDRTSTVAYSSDGRYLAAGDESGRVMLWDGQGRRSLGLLTGASRDTGGATSEDVSALAFSPDGETLAVAGNEGTLRLWDTDSHQQLGTAMPTGRDPLTALSFSPDGTSVYAAGTHTSVQRFTASPERAAPRACARAGGGLTPAQWKASLPSLPYRNTC